MVNRCADEMPKDKAHLDTVRQRVAYWLAYEPPATSPEIIDPPEEDMPLPLVRVKNTADQFMLVPINGQEGRRKMGYTDEQSIEVVADIAALEAVLSFKLTPMA